MSASRFRLLRFAEYAAVSASVVGAIATLTTQKPAYAIAPLSVAATLSLISRHEQSQRLDAAVTASERLNEASNDQVEQLRRQLQAIAQQIKAADEAGLRRQQTLQTLANTVVERENKVKAGAQAIQAIRSFVEQQENRFDFATSDRVNDLAQALQQAKSQADAELAALRSALSSVSTQTDALLIAQQATFAETQQSNQAQSLTVTEETARLDSWVESLHADFDALGVALQALALRVDELAVEPNKIDFSGVVPQLPSEDDFDLDINLGIDFGTGYTKVCFRDLARDRSEVVTFADLTTSGLTLKETLVPTRLAILEDGTLLTGLTMDEWETNDRPIRQEINYIKMRLAAIDFRRENEEDEWRLERISELDDDATVESLCAYYLSSIIERSQQWITANRPELFTNQKVRWSVNIGVPVEYCDSPALKRFERVLALAWLLKSTDVDTATLTIDRLNHLVAHLQQWMNSNKTMDELDCTTTPEIAAAIWSFINSRQAQEGFYTFFDIGDGTLDGAAFIFKQGDGTREVDCYIAQVEPLGVTAFVEKTADELGLSASDVRKSLSDSSDRSLQGKMQASATRNKVQQMVARVVMDGNEKHHEIRQYAAQQDVGSKLRVFVGGGGGNTDFFPKTIRATHSEFDQGSSDIPPYEIRQIPTPDDLLINGLDKKDFNRFAIAYGLCIPEGEGPTVQLPSQFKNVELATELITYDPDNYEDTRDAM